MKKIIAAILMAMTPVSANAGAMVYLDSDRMLLIREAASHICKAVTDEPGSASAILEKRSSYLRLNPYESLYLQALCILYITGRTDSR